MFTETDLEIGSEFASTMQQLSAEAQRPPAHSQKSADAGELNEVLPELRALNGRMRALEIALEKTSQAPGLFERLGRVDEQLAAMRKVDSVNQRLFDSLHEELIQYRDNFLRESLQKPFIRDLVGLFDDLTGLLSQLPPAEAAQDGENGRASANLENAIHSLVEILHRLEVNRIAPIEKVDLTLHRVVSYQPTNVAAEEGRIVTRVKPGFQWRDQILRPEEVVALRFS